MNHDIDNLICYKANRSSKGVVARNNYTRSLTWDFCFLFKEPNKYQFATLKRPLKSTNDSKTTMRTIEKLNISFHVFYFKIHDLFDQFCPWPSLDEVDTCIIRAFNSNIFKYSTVTKLWVASLSIIRSHSWPFTRAFINIFCMCVKARVKSENLLSLSLLDHLVILPQYLWFQPPQICFFFGQ